MRRLLFAAVFGLALTPSLRAQSISSQEIDRGLNPNGGASRWVPYDGAPFSHKYNYNLGAGILYFNGNPDRMYYLDYLDKLDRAEKFGYAPPRPPFAPVVVRQAAPPGVVVPDEEVIVPPPTTVRMFSSFGFFRRR